MQPVASSPGLLIEGGIKRGTSVLQEWVAADDPRWRGVRPLGKFISAQNFLVVAVADPRWRGRHRSNWGKSTARTPHARKGWGYAPGPLFSCTNFGELSFYALG